VKKRTELGPAKEAKAGQGWYHRRKKKQGCRDQKHRGINTVGGGGGGLMSTSENVHPLSKDASIGGQQHEIQENNPPSE